MFPVQINAVEKMGVVTSIITSVIVLVIALVIFEFLFNPYAFNGLRASLTHTISGLANNAQTVAIKTAAAVQSNKPVLYIAENSNNTVALFDMQYNKIIGYIDLNGESPNNLAIGPDNLLYVTGSYYNYHNPQYHGLISIVNSSNDKVIGTISMASVPTQITLSTNGTYAYTINNNNTESAISLQKMTVIGSFPFTSSTGIAQGQNATAQCGYSNTNTNTIISCKGLSGLNQPVTNWAVTITDQTTLITHSSVLQKNYSSPSFSDNFTLPLTFMPYTDTDYVVTVTGYANSQVVHNFTFSQSEAETSSNQNITGAPEGLVFSPEENLLFVLVNYGNCLNAPLFYTGECSDETLFALNGSNINQTLWTIPLTPDNIYSSGPKQLAITPNGSVYALIGQDQIAVINATSQKETKNIPFGEAEGGGTSLSMAPNGAYLYAINSGLQEDIVVVNTSTETIVDSKSIGYEVNSPTQLTDVAVASNFTYVVTSSIGNYGLMIINRANDSITQNVGMGSNCPCEVVVS
jgi:hypothetical protein